jgi:hypothetical protein
LSGAGTTKVENNYEFLDHFPLAGRSYYRLKQVDFDGVYSLSSIASVEFANNNITVWPNPSSGIFNMSATGGYIEVWNIQGIKILSAPLDRNETGIDISGQPAGVYVLKVYDSERVSVHRLVKK